MKELIKIYGASIAGLFLNLAIMWIVVDLLHWNRMIAKMVATGITFSGVFLFVNSLFIIHEGCVAYFNAI